MPAETKLEASAVMTIQVSCSDGRLEPLRGMLDTGAGISVMSVSAWRRVGSPTLAPWTTAIKMANDVFGTTVPLLVRMAGLYLRVEFVVVEDLREDDFLLGRTFFVNLTS